MLLIVNKKRNTITPLCVDVLSVWQFVELKGSVFKKFEKHNLFQMSCSDVRERFHLLFLLAVVGVRNLTEFSWNLGLFFVVSSLEMY